MSKDRKQNTPPNKLPNRQPKIVLRPSQSEWRVCLTEDPELCTPLRRETVSLSDTRITQNNCHACQELLSRKGKRESDKGKNLPCELLKSTLQKQ